MQKWRKEQWDQYYLEKQERNSIQNRNEVMRHPNTGSSSSANTLKNLGAPVSASENRLPFPIFSDSEDNISEDIGTYARKRMKYDVSYTKNYENHAERKAPDKHDRMRIPRTLKVISETTQENANAENSRSQNPNTIDEILDSFSYYRSLNSKMMSSNSNDTSRHPFPEARQSTSYRNSLPSSSLCGVSERRTNIPPKIQQSSTTYINKPSTSHENLKNDERRRENNTKNLKNHAEQHSRDKSSKIKTETTSKVTQISKTTQGFNNDKRSNNFPNKQHTTTTTTTNKNMPSTSYDPSNRVERKKEFDTTNFKNHTERYTSDKSSKIKTETPRVTQMPDVYKKTQEINNEKKSSHGINASIERKTKYDEEIEAKNLKNHISTDTSEISRKRSNDGSLRGNQMNEIPKTTKIIIDDGNMCSKRFLELIETLLGGKEITENKNITMKLEISINVNDGPQSSEAPEVANNKYVFSSSFKTASSDKSTNTSPNPFVNAKTNAPSTSKVTLKDEKKGKLNTKELEAIKRLFVDTLKNMYAKMLLNKGEIDLLNGFLNMDINRQYFIIKLFLSPQSWFNMRKFCERIELNYVLSPRDINGMYEDPKMRVYFDTDMKKLDIKDLLRNLAVKDLRKIERKFNLVTNIRVGKENHIKSMVDKIQNQLVLKKTAIELLGFCVKLKHETQVAFGKAYILQTFCNPAYQRDINNFLEDLNGSGVIYPEYRIENFTPFRTKDHFSWYYFALSMKRKLYLELRNNKDMSNAKKICQKAFARLKNCNDAEKWDREKPRHLHKYSAEYQYISILSNCIEKLSIFDNYKEVTPWLIHLIKYYPTNHDVALWYKNLTHSMMHVKNYEVAAKLLISIYRIHKRQHIDFLPFIELSKIADKLRTTRAYNVCQLYRDQLAPLSGFKNDIDKFPQETVQCERRVTRKKVIYIYKNNNGEDIEGDMKTIALKHYASKNRKGISCGGEFIEAVFALLFWDIIYGFYVANTFISNLQNAPLDMYSDSFYENRKENIDKRLDEIATHWSTEKLEQTLKDNWKRHSHEKSIVNFQILENVINDVLKNFRCVDRIVLSKILRRLTIHYKRFRRGFPDLFLWNTEEKKCKFVKVKDEKEELSSDEFLWIQYLKDVKTDVEICCISVPDFVPKRKIKKYSEDN